MQVADKVMVVTGGGNGIGQQVVLECLRRGARVAAADIRGESLDETARFAGAGDRLSTHVLDITHREATHAFPEAVIAAHGAADGTINVAGIVQPFVRLHELDYGSPRAVPPT
jgi:NAD(P)-dependent dehydrogenase (short-subunit alcohol dehydrogenase family)